MTKTELIEAIAHDAGLTRDEAKKALESLLENVEESLIKGEKVTLVGFGSFKLITRAKRKGRNPQTGKEIFIAQKKVVVFKPSEILIDKGTGDGGARRK
jgi:DNA-binding protein HU-beta